MADYAPNFTARIKIRYLCGRQTHSQQWRFPGVGTDPELSAALSVIGSFYLQIQDDLYEDFTINSVSVALRDSDIFLPVPNSFAVTGAVPLTGLGAKTKASQISFVGRSAGGLRAIIYQYGWGVNTGDSPSAEDFRMVEGENGIVDAAIGALITGGADIVANDGQAITWYNYANIKYNDYWVKRGRGTG